MPYRKIPLAQNEIYHIFSKSIAGFRIFNSDNDFQRFIETAVFYSKQDPPYKFSLFLKDEIEVRNNFYVSNNQNNLVKIIAYCFMPTHIHFIMQQAQEGGISEFINLVLKSYSKYFNVKYKRKGPLWEGRFKNVLVTSDEQLLHLTRYIHLNPVTAFLVDSPQDWKFSSYREYIGLVKEHEKISNFYNYLNIIPRSYREFVNERIDYQRNLAKIKELILE